MASGFKASLFQIAAVTFLIAGVVSGQNAFTVVPQDEPYYVKDGAAGPVLPCVLNATVSDRSQYEVNWGRYNNGQFRIIARNDRLIDKKKQRFALLSDPATGNYSLQILTVDRNDVEGTYHCNVIANDDSGTQFSSPKATVVVLVAPGDPIITESPDEPVAEGDTITVNCASVGGSPKPTFSWLLPNGSFADGRFTTFSSYEQTTESTLHYRVSATDNGESIICSVSNKAIEDELPRTISTSRLNVLYKPRVMVSPLENTTHLSVEVGEEVHLNCNASANPAAHSFEWKHLSSGERYLSNVWPLRAERNLSGDFMCKATNQIGEGSEILKLNVQYTPVVTVPATVSPGEKDRVELECHVDANPPVTEIKWIGPAGFKSDGPTLIIKSVSRDQTGNYSCVATNFLNVYGHTGSQQRTGSASTFIDVMRKPKKAEITAVSQQVFVGDVIELSCSSADPGNPKAMYKWASPMSGGEYGAKDHGKSTLVVRNAQLADNGEYRCMPFNELGAGPEAVIHVTVIEPAKISSPLTTERIFSSGEVNKGLDCEAQGFPTPVIVWYKDGQPVDKRRYKVVANVAQSRCAENDFCTQTTYSALTFSGALRWSDKGNYSCVAENGGNAPLTERGTWTIVRVLHAPVIINERYPIKSLAAADLGTQAKISCLVSSRPEPDFHWMFQDADIVENEKYSIHMVPVFGRPDEYEQVLQIENLQESDYGEYVCKASNGNGGDNVVIEVRKTGPPETPDSLQKLSSTSQSISIGWKPKFDGGFRQMFVIEYRRLNSFTGSVDESPIETIEVRNGTRLEDYRDDGVMTSITAYNMTGLLPLSTYYIRARAVNEKGATEFTPMVVATTNDVYEDTSLMSPSKIAYSSVRRVLDVEPKPPMDTCTLIYVLAEDSWRAGECIAAGKPIENIPSGVKYRARFCVMNSSFRCSPLSSVLETGSSSPWRTGFIAPVLVIAFIMMSMCVFCLVCCRTRAPTKKPIKLTPVTLTALPTNETKNAIVHGSQTDSGVFTLDSTRMKNGAAQNQSQHNYSSDETAVENWQSDSQYDVSNDPYLNEPMNRIFQAGVLEDQQMSDGATTVTGTDDEDGRRVMREIIV